MYARQHFLFYGFDQFRTDEVPYLSTYVSLLNQSRLWTTQYMMRAESKMLNILAWEQLSSFLYDVVLCLLCRKRLSLWLNSGISTVRLGLSETLLCGCDGNTAIECIVPPGLCVCKIPR